MAFKTSVTGFPRIGKERELKFAEEKFFKKEISLEELENTAKKIREYGWKKQEKAGITFILLFMTTCWTRPLFSMRFLSDILHSNFLKLKNTLQPPTDFRAAKVTLKPFQ